MAALPVGVGYGTVTWTAAAAVLDTTQDVDLAPDLVSVLGSVVFTPSLSVFRVPNALPPVTLFADPIEATLYSDGTLRDAEGNYGVTLLATDSPGLDVEPNSWSWHVAFNVAIGKTRAGFSFQLPTGATVDLTTIAPLSVAPGGVQVTQGRGIANATVNVSGDLIITYTTGEVVNAGNIATIVSGGTVDAETVRDIIGATLVAGTNVTITPNDLADTVTIAATGGSGGVTESYVATEISNALSALIVSYAMLPAGSTLTVVKNPTTGWPARPTARTDVIVAWKGPDPSPPIVTSGTAGMLDNTDYRMVTP